MEGTSTGVMSGWWDSSCCGGSSAVELTTVVVRHWIDRIAVVVDSIQDPHGADNVFARVSFSSVERENPMTPEQPGRLTKDPRFRTRDVNNPRTGWRSLTCVLRVVGVASCNQYLCGRIRGDGNILPVCGSGYCETVCWSVVRLGARLRIPYHSETTDRARFS